MVSPVYDRDLKFNWYRVNNDVFGNPRYVTHYLNLITKKTKNLPILERYDAVIKFANKLGGRKFHNKQFGGGIVFQSYNLKSTENFIIRKINEVNNSV